MSQKTNIRTWDLEKLTAYMLSIGEKRFRAQQVYEWLWQKGVGSFTEMQNISKSLRAQLEAEFTIDKIQLIASQKSSDGTTKYAFETASGHQIEGVLIPTSKRITACVSSQSGCSLHCKFCATGYLGFQHNLKHYEIFDQIFTLRKEAELHFGKPLTNIVYMGMGEPLLNYKNVMQSIHIVTAPEGLGMSPQRITVSTAGIAKLIKKMADEDAKFEFAVSLHAANDEKRSQIMDINDSNNLELLTDALRYFYDKTRTRVTYEYCIFKDFNDTLEDAAQLVDFSRIIPSKINIIEYNPVPESGLVNTTPTRMQAFIQYLESKGVIVNVRRSRGKDIDGACGQLALRHTRQPTN